MGPETDLTLSIEGRRFLNGDGKHNMPCGEVHRACGGLGER